jgi:hypothetical protein
MKLNYLCDTYQEFLERLVYQVSRGYYFFHVNYLPEGKFNKFTEIDKKLIGKYDAEKSKHQRYRQKQKQEANYYYLRWYNVFVILKTEGKVSLNETDKFTDIRGKGKGIIFKVSDITELKVGFSDIIKKGGESIVTVRLTSEYYRGLKDVLIGTIKNKVKSKIIYEFGKLNGFPAWHGIVQQKLLLADFVVEQSRKNNVPMERKELRIIMSRRFKKPTKVIKENEES